MKLIVCLDDNNGMAFNNRRQSKDRIVKNRILELSANDKLWMNPYSGKQFSLCDQNVIVDDNYLHKAEENDYCFTEIDDLTQHIDSIKEIVVFRWNRKYPSDLYFPLEMFDRFKRVSTDSYAGHSHEKIIQEVYRL